jgi:hypothetical protein
MKLVKDRLVVAVVVVVAAADTTQVTAENSVQSGQVMVMTVQTVDMAVETETETVIVTGVVDAIGMTIIEYFSENSESALRGKCFDRPIRIPFPSFSSF